MKDQLAWVPSGHQNYQKWPVFDYINAENTNSLSAHKQTDHLSGIKLRNTPSVQIAQYC